MATRGMVHISGLLEVGYILRIPEPVVERFGSARSRAAAGATKLRRIDLVSVATLFATLHRFRF